jgi:hypothetical protein
MHHFIYFFPENPNYPTGEMRFPMPDNWMQPG